MDPKREIAVVGPTGIVGRELLAGLWDRGHPPERLTLLGSERAEGMELDYGDDSLEVERATAESFRGMALVLFATPPEVSAELCPKAQAAGAWVVDLSAAFRGDPRVPLLLPPFEGPLPGFEGRIARCPSTGAAALTWLLQPLRERFGLVEVLATAMVGASYAGRRGVEELEAQTAGLLSGRELEATSFPQRLGFNLVPQVGAFTGDFTLEEERLVSETRALLGQRGPGPLPVIGATAIQAPIFYGYNLSLALRLGRAAKREELLETLGGSPLLKVLDTPAEGVYPMPMLVTADPTVHVGRLRPIAGSGDGWLAFASLDNAGRGAAQNALELGEALLQRGG